MRVRIIRNPAGRFRLAYEVGEVVDLPDAQAKELVHFEGEGGPYAVATKEPLRANSNEYSFNIDAETASTKAKPEKR